MKRTYMAVLTLALGLAAADGVRADRSRLSSQDRRFLIQAAQGGVAEVRLAELAASNAVSAEARSFAEQVYMDHGRANRELDSLARARRVPLPSSLSAEHGATYARLARFYGDIFDVAYMRVMVRDHVRDVAVFQREARSGRDPVLRAWASRMLPGLRRHLAVARARALRLGAGIRTYRFRY